MLEANNFFHGRTDGKPRIEIGGRIFVPLENCLLLPGNPTTHRYTLNWLPPSSNHLKLLRKSLAGAARIRYITDESLARKVAEEAVRYGSVYLVRNVRYKPNGEILRIRCFEGRSNYIPNFTEQRFEAKDLTTPIEWTAIFWFEVVFK
ncbi:MAG: hypothetical protein JWP09_809 [Candidatus Taylorbacteria bacterium]|nr:hypothetical protein [Candidatus Taylorbacteria bacterium]